MQRVYTPAELEDRRVASEPDTERLATTFAVKEATMKVLRPSEEDAVPWRSIEVRRESYGALRIELSGRAAELAADAGIGALAASATREAGFAAALVIATDEIVER